MTNVTLTYFDAPVSRGEECRLALTLAGISFKDERLSRPEWESRKPKTPYGAVPVFTADGHPPLAQSNAILGLIGRLNALHPSEPWEAARHEALMGAVEDFRARVGATRRIEDPAARKAAREELSRGYLQEWGAQVEAQIRGPFVGGEAIQVADVKLFVAQTPLREGTMDHIPKDVFQAFPKLNQQYQAVKSHPKVVAWYAR